MRSKWRKIMLIVIAVNIIPVVYGLILIFTAAGKVGFGNLLGDNYANPVLWLSGAVVAGNAILFIGAIGLLLNTKWGIEGIKIGAGLVFVFQCLAIAVAGASWIGDMFAVGQGRFIDEVTGDPKMMTGPVMVEISLNRFLNPRMFATTWLSIAQMIILMTAVEKEKKEVWYVPDSQGQDARRDRDGAVV